MAVDLIFSLLQSRRSTRSHRSNFAESHAKKKTKIKFKCFHSLSSLFSAILSSLISLSWRKELFAENHGEGEETPPASPRRQKIFVAGERKKREREEEEEEEEKEEKEEFPTETSVATEVPGKR